MLMKKIASLFLSLVLIFGLAVPALADNTLSTTVSYTASSTSGNYTVDVPASLVAGGDGGTVKVEGVWSARETLTVTADSSITMYNGEETASATVNFDGISQKGDSVNGFYAANNTAITKDISVDAPNVVIGSWTGKINYQVSLKEAAVSSISVTTAPAKTTYYVGETFDPTGMQVTVTYDDGSSEVISTGFTYGTGAFTATDVGTKAVTVSYDGKETTVSVTVKVKKSSVTIKSAEEWTEFVNEFNKGANSEYVQNTSVILDYDLTLTDGMSLGSESYPFTGSFNGLNYTVVQFSSVPLFGGLGNGAKVSYLKLKNFDSPLITSAEGTVLLENITLVNCCMDALIQENNGTVTLTGLAKDSELTAYANTGTGTINHSGFENNGNSSLPDD